MDILVCLGVFYFVLHKYCYMHLQKKIYLVGCIDLLIHSCKYLEVRLPGVIRVSKSMDDKCSVYEERRLYCNYYIEKPSIDYSTDVKYIKDAATHWKQNYEMKNDNLTTVQSKAANILGYRWHCKISAFLLKVKTRK